MEHIRAVGAPLVVVPTFDFASTRGVLKLGAGDCTHSCYSPFAYEPLLNRITAVISRSARPASSHPSVNRTSSRSLAENSAPGQETRKFPLRAVGPAARNELRDERLKRIDEQGFLEDDEVFVARLLRLHAKSAAAGAA